MNSVLQMEEKKPTFALSCVRQLLANRSDLTWEACRDRVLLISFAQLDQMLAAFREDVADWEAVRWELFKPGAYKGEMAARQADFEETAFDACLVLVGWRGDLTHSEEAETKVLAAALIPCDKIWSL